MHKQLRENKFCYNLLATDKFTLLDIVGPRVKSVMRSNCLLSTLCS